MERCRGAASKCVQCLVAHVPPFFWVFQGLPDKNFDWQFVLVAQILVDDPLAVKKQMSIDLILDLLILLLLRRGEFAASNYRLWRFVSGSYSKIHDSSPVITRLKNSGFLSRRSRKSRHIPPIGLLLSREVFWNHLGTQFLTSKSCVKNFGR